MIMKNHKTTLVETPAQAGGLDGWSIICQDCGNVGGYSILGMSQKYAREHTSYMLRKEGK